MSIIGIGTDIVQISRLTESILAKVLSPQELAEYHRFSAVSRKQEYLAGRFAAKEALRKALPGEYPPINLTDIVIMNTKAGKPFLALPTYPEMVVSLSIAHERDYAIAFCVLEAVTE